MLEGQILKLHTRHSLLIRKILVSVKFLSAILGPEMAVPILWEPRFYAFFLQENLHVHKIPRFRGWYFGLGEGEVPIFYLYGRGDFSDLSVYGAIIPRSCPLCRLTLKQKHKQKQEAEESWYCCEQQWQCPLFSSLPIDIMVVSLSPGSKKIRYALHGVSEECWDVLISLSWFGC